MVQDLLSLDVLHERELGHDAGVGNHDIEVLDAMRFLERRDQVGRILLDRGIVLDHDEAGSRGLGEVGEALGAGALRAAGGGYDGLYARVRRAW